MWLLSKIKGFLSVESRVNFYEAYIQPHLDFCNIIWGNVSQTHLLKIYRVQKWACRIILNYVSDDVTENLNDLRILTTCIYEHIFLRKLKFMFKVYVPRSNYIYISKICLNLQS